VETESTISLDIRILKTAASVESESTISMDFRIESRLNHGGVPMKTNWKRTKTLALSPLSYYCIWKMGNGQIIIRRLRFELTWNPIAS